MFLGDFIAEIRIDEVEKFGVELISKIQET